MNALGEVVFKGSNDGNDEGVFLWQGAVVTASACEGAAAPTLGGVYRDFGEHVDINLGTDVIFMAEVDNAGFIDAIYAGPTTGVVPIAVEGDALAGTTIKGFDEDIRPSINDARQAAFYTRLAAAPFAAIAGTVGLGGAPAIVLLNGAACPFGGAIGSFGEEVDVSPSGEVVAEVGCTGGRGVIRGTAGGGFASVGNNNDLTAVGSGWLFSDGQIDGAGDLIVRSRRTSLYGSICGGGGCAPPLLMAKSPLVIPGSTGGTIEAIDRDSVNGSKEAVFTAVLSGLNRTDAILRARPGAPITKVVESLDPLPVAVGTFGGFSSIDPFTDQVWRAAGQGRKVAFAATVNSLAYERGMFQAKGATARDPRVRRDGGAERGHTRRLLFAVHQRQPGRLCGRDRYR